MKIGARVNFFNVRMRERRKEFGWTQKDLGERCEVVSTTISNIESLKSRKPTPETKGLLIRIADELDCEFEEFKGVASEIVHKNQEKIVHSILYACKVRPLHTNAVEQLVMFMTSRRCTSYA